MLTDLEIDNFQSHKHTALEFHPGVNVVLGPSDTGKSAIIRALTWGVTNRPGGDAFHSNFTKEPTTVSLAFTDDVFVTRKKGKGVNEYITEDGVLKALRSEVPETVQNITRMEELNIQKQYKSYFLLDETPGFVAKAFNSVAGLEDMDIALKNVNGRLRKSVASVGDQTEAISILKDEIAQLDWTADASQVLETLAEQFTLLSAERNKYVRLLKIQTDLKMYTDQLLTLPTADAIHEIDSILALDVEIEKEDEHFTTIEGIATQLSLNEKALAKINAICDLDISEATSLVVSIDDDNARYQTLTHIANELGTQEINLKAIDAHIATLLEEKDIINKSIDVCELCGQAWDESCGDHL